MIHFKNVDIRLNGFALEGVNFRVPNGAYAVLMGRTGCGKTTLLESACGLRPIAGGRIYLMDRDVTDMPPGRRNLGLVPQDGALFSTMTVAQNLGFALQVRKSPASDIKRRVNELAGLLGIDHLLGRVPQGLFQAASANAWPLGGHWRQGRMCCALTNRSRHWMNKRMPG